MEPITYDATVRVTVSTKFVVHSTEPTRIAEERALQAFIEALKAIDLDVVGDPVISITRR